MLTERIVRDAKPGPKNPYPVGWSTVKGLGLRITPKGAQILHPQAIASMAVKRRATLARASEISLKIARERAGGSASAHPGRRSRPARKQAGGKGSANGQPTGCATVLRRVRPGAYQRWGG